MRRAGLRGKDETEDSIIGPFYIRQTAAFYAAVHRHDDIHVHIQRGGRLLHIELCVKDAVCGNKPYIPIF